VAGTQSAPALPVLDIKPPPTASRNEHSLSLSPPARSVVGRMSCSSEPPSHTGTHLQDVHSGIATESKDAETVFTTAQAREPVTSSAKRSEVLRYVFPRPSSNEVTPHRKPVARITKPEHRRTGLLAFRQARSRVAFQRVITSIFNHGSTRDLPILGTSKLSSSTSSIVSRTGSMHGSLPSVELISPGAFLFSGPSLHSARSRSGSLSQSTSQLPSLGENESESDSIRRLQSESFSVDSVSLSEDGILEPPVEHGITRSFSEVLLSVDALLDELQEPIVEDLDEDGYALELVARPNHQARTAQSDANIAAFLCPYLDAATRKALRSTCRAWLSALDAVAPPKFPASYNLPTELLQHIFELLGPKDFNAARHTCRNWMRASLDKSLLVAMLQRGGWWTSTEHDLERNQTSTSVSNSTSESWFLSCRLSRECALSGDWSGNGLDTSASTPIHEVASMEFADLANGHTKPLHGSRGGLVFTTSVCGSFLLVARETLIYVYQLSNTSLLPLTSVTCPRRVLSMSMDVSSGRYAVAALLEGRMGIVCELRLARDSGTDSSVDVHVGSQTCDYRAVMRAANVTSRVRQTGTGRVEDCTSSGTQFSQSTWPQWTTFSTVEVQANHEAIALQGTDDHRTYDQNWINHTWNLNLRGILPTSSCSINAKAAGTCAAIIPIETGTSTFYRHLRSEDDPPRSVAICPQRRCVAFGCSAGIELHWIDALTDQSLSRWFPLAAPSDHLYFMSPRPGFESAKKLRLISSAAHPDDRPAINRKFSISRPTISSFWASYGFDSGSGRLETSSCDHFHAVPLSDGHHILFIEPPTRKLFLGCDAPLGGPTKLLRKILLLPPREGLVPQLYTAAADMTQGARVAVAYEDTIVLYSIPPDVIAVSRLEQKAESWDIYTAPPFSSEGRTKNHWLNWQDEPCAAELPGHSPIWPLAVRGTVIGTLPGVCTLAINTHPEITIWAFALDSQCKTWQLRNSAEPIHRSRRYVCRSGIVHTSYSVDGARDVIMTDVEEMHTPTNDIGHPDVQRTGGFDGSSSQPLGERISRALHIENDEWVELLDVRGCDAGYNMDGDVVLTEPRRPFTDWGDAVWDE
jgi:hypothetical protein